MLHIAVDIGASSGRLVAGERKENKLEIKEIHRFANGFMEREGTSYWDIDHLLMEIVKGLATVKKLGYETCTVGIDTWAVDYVLIDEKGNRLQEAVSYRDKRTEKTIEKLTKKISKGFIYEKTGIQFLPFNTIYQLFEEAPELIRKTDKILMVPDYLGFRLTGNAVLEVTNASTMQLLNVKKRDFDDDLLELISVKKEQFPYFSEPGQELGRLKKEWFPSYDLPDCKIVTVASHDTASAVAGTPGIGEGWAYLSSGTWSLLGIETSEPVITDLSLENNYTNEWGTFQSFRFLKNIIGMWIIQEVRKSLPQDYNYSQFVEEAKKVERFQRFINFNDDRFINPIDMAVEIQAYCRETNQPIPETAGELAGCIYDNLAIIYTMVIKELEEITGQSIDCLHIVGGGAQNELLNQLTADVSGKTVYAGPSEATAIGNLLLQMIAAGELADLHEGRQLIRKSFDIKEFIPAAVQTETLINRFNQYG
ncbi:rhamnulokinase [Neobacillus vireti]|uniref:Rhamnulokinase n=1 Tax=Neobacillus vireti LMG 21834 TaxID=1131730 RepID=A0AB94IJS1_9BACI|nr:rhamnulokinase [Neobacillus vireti]ETI67284.1 rhamnulokinase [Neobacillus vireti LMG 21834]KLT18048.1 rhamnulokinase [Neobacillus vireti]